MLRAFLKKLLTTVLILFIATYIVGASIRLARGGALGTNTFSPGDIISADVMNELFATVSRLVSPPEMSDLVGSWECSKIMMYSTSYDGMFQHYQTLDANGLWRSLQVPLVIADSGGGAYTWDSGATYNAFTYGLNGDLCPGQGKLSLYKGKLAVTWSHCGNYPDSTDIFKVKILSDSEIEIDAGGGGGQGGINSVLLVCTKQNASPAAPSSLAAMVSGRTVSLSWTDNSSTETGFKVLRKHALTDDYSVIYEPAANTGSYQDTVPEAGSYWYWLRASNAFGDSDGSNVVLVEVQ